MGFLFFFFFCFLLVVVVGGVMERRREGWSSTQLELGEKIVFRQCVFGKEDEFALHCGFTHSKGSRACVKNVQVHKGATELRN